MQVTGEDMGDQLQNVGSCDAIDNNNMCTLIIDVLVAFLMSGGLNSTPLADPSGKHRSRHQISSSLSVLCAFLDR